MAPVGCRPTERAAAAGSIPDLSGSRGVTPAPGGVLPTLTARNTTYIHNYRYRRSLPSRLLHAFLDLLQVGRGRTMREIGNVSV